jgi:diadenosine tetraphosphatase ApaH/serine/threonine PP2A family protein phosphatase
MAKKNEVHKVVHRKLGKEKAWGLADTEKNTIEIDERLMGYRYLLICLHEHFHLKHPDWSETKVRKESSKTARFLWNLGFRWVDQTIK